MNLIVSENILAQKFKAYFDLTKFRLSSTVVFSSVIGFTLASDKIIWSKLILFSIAAFATTAAANIINQIIERNLDKLMTRTENRPLPSGRLSLKEAAVFGWIMAAIAMYILFYEFNASQHIELGHQINIKSNMFWSVS